MPEQEPSFPPLLRGKEAGAGQDPFAQAISAATLGTDAGLIVYQLSPDMLQAAMVLAPECVLEDALAMVFALQIGFGDALGALAPPEVAVHFDWPLALRVNGAKCGAFRAAASHNDPAREPDWLVIGLSLPIMDFSENPGESPEVTNLYDEGCAEVDPSRLLESWARHSLVWINRWSDDGMAPLHTDWCARAFSMGEEISLDLKGTKHTGTFMGLDEKGGMLLRNGDKTQLLPLSAMLE